MLVLFPSISHFLLVLFCFYAIFFLGNEQFSIVKSPCFMIQNPIFSPAISPLFDGQNPNLWARWPPAPSPRSFAKWSSGTTRDERRDLQKLGFLAPAQGVFLFSLMDLRKHCKKRKQQPRLVTMNSLWKLGGSCHLRSWDFPLNLFKHAPCCAIHSRISFVVGRFYPISSQQYSQVETR